MKKGRLTAREKSRQERERAKSLDDRSRQLMKKAGQLQQKAQREDVQQAAAQIAKPETKD
jgi:predicted metalloprotease with PDZ domain